MALIGHMGNPGLGVTVMRNDTTGKRLFCLFMVFIVIALPAISQVEPERLDDPKVAAEQQAMKDTAKTLTRWLGFGCLLGPLGILISVSASPPAVALIGKSPDYVSEYMDTYKKTSVRLRLTYSGIGCIGNLIGGYFLLNWILKSFEM